MTDHHIRRMVDELVGSAAADLGDTIASTIGGRMLFATPPRAMVLQLDIVRASSGGLRREVTVLASVEVHL